MSFDSLWGELAPVPERNVHVVGDRILGFEAFPTPGHAWHHVSYLDADGTLYAGDAAGVRIAPSGFVLPPCPPPELDLEAWERTIEEIERRTPGRLALIHFGTFDDVEEHLAALRETLRPGASRVENGMDESDVRRRRALRRRAVRPRSSWTRTTGRAVLAPLPRPRALLAQAARVAAGRAPRPVGGDILAPTTRGRVRLEVVHRDELERRGVRRLEHDRRRDAGLERLVPALRDDAPAVARPRAPGRATPAAASRGRSRRERENSRNSTVITAQIA